MGLRGRRSATPSPGQPLNLTFDWSLPDHWQKLLASNDILIHWSYDYNPVPLGSKGAIPPEPQWSEVVGTTWKHLRDLGDPFCVLHEVWNEPDFKGFGFFDGTEQQYYELYARTARKLRDLDKDAKIAGPTTAFPFWLPAFTDYVRNNKLPARRAHFSSVHATRRQRPHRPGRFCADSLSRIRQPSKIVLDEYHNFNPWRRTVLSKRTWGQPSFGTKTHPPRSAATVTSLNWAQFQDPGLHTDQLIGLITSGWACEGHLQCLSTLRNDARRCRLTNTSGSPLSVMASADEHRAGIIVLNLQPRTRSESR